MDLLQLFLGVTLCAISYSIGLSQGPAQFKRIIAQPRPFFIALFCQIVVVPSFALLIALCAELPTNLAFGLMLIAVCPGGVSSNLFTRLAGGDTALSVSLTLFHSLFAVLSIPFILYLALPILSVGESRMIAVPYGLLLQQLVFVSLLPLILGIFTRYFFSEFASRIERTVIKLVSSAFFSLILLMWWRNWVDIQGALVDVGTATMLLLACATLTAWLTARGFGLARAQESALVIEVGIQNSAAAFFIAVDVLEDLSMTAPAAVYSVAMTLFALILIFMYRYRAS